MLFPFTWLKIGKILLRYHAKCYNKNILIKIKTENILKKLRKKENKAQWLYKVSDT